MNSRTTISLYSNSSDHFQHRASLSVVPKLSSTPKYVSFRVCRTFRNRDNTQYVLIYEDNTLEQLKEKIWRQLVLPTNPIDFSLAKFNETNDVWISIDDANACKAIADLNLPDYTTLNVEPHGKTNTSSLHISEVRDNDLPIKLCKRPMNKAGCYYLDTYASITIGELKENARKQVSNQRTNHLYLWRNSEWMKLETNIDDLTLAEMEFEKYSIVSFEADDDCIPGVCGLTNLGNTCFMNSALQCLSNIPELTRKMLSFGNEMNAPVIGAYSTLIKVMWSGEHIVTMPSSLLLNIRENLPRFARYRQQDAQEFMNYFLHSIHQEFTSEKTLITDLFYGQIRSSVKCLGECRSIETNKEPISFLPLPIENNIDQYNILYLRSNGKHHSVSVHVRARTIDTLIEEFIKQHEPTLSSRQVQCVKIVDNQIVDRYSPYKWLDDTIEYQLTFIELPEKTVEQTHVEFVFLNRKTNKPFRPPVFLVRQHYGCRYRDLVDQIDRIKDCLYKVTNAQSSPCYVSWINDKGEIHQLNEEANSHDSLLFMKQIAIEMEPEWVEKYTDHYNFNHPSDKASLISLLADFFHEELLNGDYYCSTCLSLAEAKQKAELALPLPLVLIIQLKRFTYDTYSDAKIDTYIDFPLTDLDLNQYVSQSDKKNKDISALYDLVAVSNHTGSLVSGHYTTYAKNDGNKNWYSFNDERFRKIDEKDIVTKNAYILVYVKRTAL